MFCLYHVHSYLAFELHMNLLNNAFFFPCGIINLGFVQ